jgi:hypothetical protein
MTHNGTVPGVVDDDGATTPSDRKVAAVPSDDVMSALRGALASARAGDDEALYIASLALWHITAAPLVGGDGASGGLHARVEALRAALGVLGELALNSERVRALAAYVLRGSYRSAPQVCVFCVLLYFFYVY